MDFAAAAQIVGEQGLALGVVATVFVAGLRHGFDVDHVAAISDITSSQSDRKRSLVLATIYALGHLSVIFVLGVIAVLAGHSVSSSIDSVFGRLIGVTLVALGIYVVYAVVRYRRDFHLRSRWMLVLAGVRRVVHRLRPSSHVIVEHDHPHPPREHHEHPHTESPTREGEALGRRALATATTTHTHPHRHVVPAPLDPFTEYGVKTSFAVGMVHGVGAETPTQILLFTSAAGIAGTMGGVALVAAFSVGLLIGNSVLVLVATAGFTAGRRLPWLHLGLGVVTAAVSIYVGLAYALARPELLPSFLGG